MQAFTVSMYTYVLLINFAKLIWFFNLLDLLTDYTLE